MAVFPVVKGTRLRGTRVNSCGLPQSGPAAYVVTDGFVSFTISPVFQEAEELEHAVSDKLLARMDALLGHPSFDPHGDPIPTPGGKVPDEKLCALTHAPGGRPLLVARITDQDPAFLRYAEKQGLRPGAQVELMEKDTAADAVLVRCPKQKLITLGNVAAAKILVKC